MAFTLEFPLAVCEILTPLLMDEMVSVATLICTMGRPTELFNALRALEVCDPPPAEVIVSDDSPSSDRRTQELCGKFNGVRYQVGPRAGLSANRNSCVSSATSDWLHFIDDDVIVSPSTYGVLNQPMIAHAGNTIVVGSQRDHRAGRIEEFFPTHHGFWTYMMPAAPSEANCVVINAAFFPRVLFEKIKFDEFLKYGCEESDISIHAICIGFKFKFVKEFIVDHYPSTVNRETYRGWLIASQVYAGLKRQWMYNQSRLTAVAFICIAIPRLLIHTLRKHGIWSFFDGTVQTFRALIHFVGMITHPPAAERKMAANPETLPRLLDAKSNVVVEQRT